MLKLVCLIILLGVCPFFFLSLIYTQEPLECKSEECFRLTLENALSRALNYNRQLINVIDSFIKSEYGVILAESEFDIKIAPNGRAGYGGGHAGTGISVGGGVDFFKKFVFGTTFTLNPFISKINKHYHSDIETVISQPLLRGFGREYQLSPIRSAQFAYRSAQRALYIAQVQLAIRTITALYEVVKAQTTAKLNQESYQRIQKFYQAAKLKESIGLSDALDVYRAEMELRHAQDDLTSSQERLQEALDTIRDLLALPLNLCIQVDVPLDVIKHQVCLEEAVETALKNRIEIEQAEDQVKDNCRLSYIAKKNLYPELNLVLNYSNSGQDEIFTRACTRNRESTWRVGFTTSSDFDPVGDRAAYDQSLLALKSAKRGIEQAKATVTLEVKKALRQIERANKRIQLQAEQIQTALGELYLSQLKFDRGMADNFNIIQAEKSLRSAQLSYWNAIIDRIVGEYLLLAAIGLLTDKPCI